ncbi:hypothetical protein SAMN05216529_10826 [Faecalicatena contorta]|uniref:Uncharacterized protein n=1 Tax=Faecalicatena contorta TaxID=39482 RepID=A0A315ZU59_9FIRM|nr:hypothetical protein A8805_10826 [Faecalicatena contorta]SUQ14801.1 hypothetical protein SAMN05216529_10826 [Faecalicatena contorta]
MAKGEVTAFLSLIFVLLISFITAMLESTVIQVSKNQKRLDVDNAIFSIFGEYQKELLEEYEILAIDGNYGTGSFQEQNLLDHMRYYGTAGIEHDIQGIQYLSDNKGSAFREQVLEYMEQAYGISIIRELAGKTGVWKEQEMQGEEANQENEKVNMELEEFVEESEIMLPEEENPLHHIEELKQSGILKLVLPKEFQVSARGIVPEEQVSSRNLRGGRGSFYIRQNINGIEDRLLFHEYLLKKFGNAAESKGENRSLSYELEYLIGGSSSDVENLEAVVKKLLAVRFGINYLYLQSDSVKQAEAEAMALSLSVLAGLPAVSGFIKQALLAAWAFGESVVDLRVLLSGKKAALIKNNENWQLSLSALITLGTGEDMQEGMDAEGGLTYKDYLRILLFLENEGELTMKALDRVEQNMRSEKEAENFCVDSCVVKLKLQNKAEIRKGLTYQFPVYFGYE